jgi:hypothetical protein
MRYLGVSWGGAIFVLLSTLALSFGRSRTALMIGASILLVSAVISILVFRKGSLDVLGRTFCITVFIMCGFFGIVMFGTAFTV